MSVKSLSSIKSLYSVKTLYSDKEGASPNERTQQYSTIEVDGAHFIAKGLLRHALKYAYFVSEARAIIKVSAKGVRKTFGFSNKEYSFWQIRHECAKALGDRTVF